MAGSVRRFWNGCKEQKPHRGSFSGNIGCGSGMVWGIEGSIRGDAGKEPDGGEADCQGQGADQPVDTRGDSGEDSGKGAQEEPDDHRVGHFGDDIVFAALIEGTAGISGISLGRAAIKRFDYQSGFGVRSEKVLRQLPRGKKTAPGSFWGNARCDLSIVRCQKAGLGAYRPTMRDFGTVTKKAK